MERFAAEFPKQWARGGEPGAPGAPARPVVRRRAFRCFDLGREVEVEFLERGLPGFRCQIGVQSCTAFDPPTEVACGRQCIDPAYRRRWESPLPVQTRATDD